jgi:hypothetical protein
MEAIDAATCYKNALESNGPLFASKNHAFCSRTHPALGALAESAEGDFQPIKSYVLD